MNPSQPNFLIPRETLLSGAKASIANGMRLRFDAELLFANREYLSAHTLAVLAIEEFGKSVFLSKRYYEGKGVTEKEYRKIFTNHPAKISFFLEQTTVLLDPKDVEPTKAWFREMGSAEHGEKMRSIYVDWEDKWLVPKAIGKGTSRLRAIEAKKTSSFYWYFANKALKGNFPRQSQKSPSRIS